MQALSINSFNYKHLAKWISPKNLEVSKHLIVIYLYVYLHKFKMNKLWRITAHDRVGTVFGTMAHTIMSGIPTNGNILSFFLQTCQHSCLVLFPIKADCWEKFFLEIIKIYINILYVSYIALWIKEHWYNIDQSY